MHLTFLRISGAGLLFYLALAINGHIHHSYPEDHGFQASHCPAGEPSPAPHSCVPETALFHFFESARPQLDGFSLSFQSGTPSLTFLPVSAPGLNRDSAPGRPLAALRENRDNRAERDGSGPRASRAPPRV
ncbi:MAG: hypothetical protein HS115_00640 [Spirochaetales bacterium]|nr:hypothetical protein [Spirochaetales bacterium]